MLKLNKNIKVAFAICVTTRVRTEDAYTDYSVLLGNADESDSARITSRGAFPGPRPVRICWQAEKECARVALNKTAGGSLARAGMAGRLCTRGRCL